MKDAWRHVAKVLGLTPLVIDHLFAAGLFELRPLPPLEARARVAATVGTLLLLAVTVTVTWRPHVPPRRWLTIGLLAVMTGAALLGYYAVLEVWPQHSVLVDAFQVSLWGAFFGLFASTIGVAVDSLALKLLRPQQG